MPGARASAVMVVTSFSQNIPVSASEGLTLPKQGMYHQTSNIRRTLADSKIADHSDEVGASPVGAAPTTSSFST